MDTEIKIFSYNGNNIRIIQKGEEIWWVLKDVCGILELTSPHKVATRLDDDEKGFDIIDTNGGKQKLTVISKSGLFNVILQSRKPKAKNFKHWITHEVLPSIRKHGTYDTPTRLEELMMVKKMMSVLTTPSVGRKAPL